MKLAEALTTKELKALEKFTDHDTLHHLRTFQGTIINLAKTFDAAPTKKFRRSFGFDVVPMIAYSSIDDARRGANTVLDISNERLVFNPHSGTQLRVDTKLKNTQHFYHTKTPPIPTEGFHKLQDMGGTVRPSGVLFEVKDWEQMRGKPAPALEDPAIIQQLVGDLWMVVYSWDLTDVEKAALTKAGVGI